MKRTARVVTSFPLKHSSFHGSSAKKMGKMYFRGYRRMNMTPINRKKSESTYFSVRTKNTLTVVFVSNLGNNVKRAIV